MPVRREAHEGSHRKRAGAPPSSGSIFPNLVHEREGGCAGRVSPFACATAALEHFPALRAYLDLVGERATVREAMQAEGLKA